MKKLLKRMLFIFFLPFLFLAAALPAVHAHCPLCTAAVGAAAVSAGYYGVDMTIVGLFVGAFGVSTGLWFGRKIKTKYIPFQLPLIVIASFLLTVVPLMSVNGGESFFFPVLLFGAAGTFFNKVYWLNKMLVGGSMGGLLTAAGFQFHLFLKKRNDDKVFFPFQGMAVTLAMLAVAGFMIFFMV